MTWSISIGGHLEDRSQEKQIADDVREFVEEIILATRDRGLSTASFYGNEYTENFLTSIDADKSTGEV